jgi:transcriptional regulator with XRE-family HTH domain
MAVGDACQSVGREFGRVNTPLPFLHNLIAMIYLGKTIRRLRDDRGVSQQELARSAKLTPSFLSLVENDRRRPSLAVLRRIADALEVPEEVLIWDAVDLPADLSEKDRRLCEMAKIIVRRLYEASHGRPHPNHHPS